MVEEAVYISSGTISTTNYEDTYYSYSNLISTQKYDPEYRFDKTRHIGDFILPYEVTIRYEKEEDVWCATCDELLIVSCSFDDEKAKKGLENELKDRIYLYVHLLKEEDLDNHAKEYRAKLLEIERLNIA